MALLQFHTSVQSSVENAAFGKKKSKFIVTLIIGASTQQWDKNSGWRINNQQKNQKLVFLLNSAIKLP